ncbi:hypothetical protein BD413DRAFT_611267 [Trametes elegans]|nr:hypothetical protein BD413DRAFT_611267 [Trametes elegans]
MAESCTVRAPFDDADADVILRSADHFDFRVYKVVLAKASPVFRDMFTLPEGANTAGGEARVVPLTESGDAIDGLLRMCYPVERPAFATLDELLPVFTAAKKYDFAVAASTLARTLDGLLQTVAPQRMYAVALLHDMPALARRAARALLRDPAFLAPPTMPPEYRALAGDAFYVLARYRAQCLAAALAVVDDREWDFSGDHAHKMMYSNKGNPHLYSTWVWYACEDPLCTPDRSLEIFVGKKQGGKMLYPCRWWSHYVSMLREALHAGTIDGRVATNPKMKKPALSEAAALEKRINAAIDNINLVLPQDLDTEDDKELLLTRPETSIAQDG